MTRLDAMRALLQQPIEDGYTRAHEIVCAADASKLRIKAVAIKSKPKRKRKASKRSATRLSWVEAVHYGGKGA